MLGAANSQYQANVNAANAAGASNSGMMGGLLGVAGAGLGAVTGGTEAGLRRQARGEADRILAEEEKARVEAPPVAQEPQPSPTQAIEDQAAELERQQQRQQAAMERSRTGMMGGGSDVNQAMLEQGRIRKEQQERAAAAEEKAAEAERQRALRAERVRIGSTQYSGDPMMNEVLRSRAIADFDAANAPKPEAPKPAPEYQPTKTIEQTTPIEQPKDFNVLRGVDARNADLMSAVAERRAAEEAAATAQTKQAESQNVEQAAKTDASRADVDQRVAQVENFLMSPVRKTQQENADYMAGVIPEMQKDFLDLLDEDMNQPLTKEQTEALKSEIRQRLQPEVAQEVNAQRTPFKSFLASKGMNTKDVQDIFGENAFRANQQLPGSVRADAPRLDMLAEAAVQAGFLKEEDTQALTDMIKAELGGDEQVAADMADDRAAAEYEAQRENEVMSRAGAIGLDTKGMAVDEVANRLDRIERQREAKRKQYSKDVDGFADLPTAEQDRIIDVMTDRFGEPQVFDVQRAEQEGEVEQVDDAVKEAIAAERPSDIRYKRATGKVGIGKQAVQDTVDTVKARWANAPEVVVAENMDDPAIPQEVRDHNKEAVAKGAKGSPQGFYYKGKAYVIADSIGSTNEAVEALMHEALGHFGLRGVFGPKMEAVLRDVIKNRRTEVESKAEQYGLDPKNDKDMLEAAEEVLAVMAQTKPGLPFVKRALVIIRDFLRGLGFDIKMSDADIIQKYILPARAFVESGKGRPTEGKPAAMRGEAPKTGPGTPAFDRWFGDSKVVDENGNPKVMYHGTGFGFNSFWSNRGNLLYFAKNPVVAEGYAERVGEDQRDMGNYDDEIGERSEDGGASIYPVYLSAQNIFDAENEAHLAKLSNVASDELRRSGGDYDYVESNQSEIKAAGFDGVYVRENPDILSGDRDIAVFSPSQIKSATGNIGTYDPDNADIRYQREAEPEAGQPKPSRQNIFGEPVLGTWSITVDPKMELQDGLIYKLLDKNIDVKRIVEAVKSTGKQIASQWNPYLQEELYHGRTANASQEFQDKEWLPLLQDMDKKGVTIGELEKYLHNRHAEDYNKLVAKRNPNRPEMQDGGSGVTTESARKYLAGLDADTKAKYDELAARVDGITKGTRKLLLDTGYENQEKIRAWEKAFPNYVPLMREEGDFDYNFGSFGTGRGFDVRRDFSRSAMGSKRNVVDIIGNVIAARNNAIALTEKNRVAQAVYGLALEAPNPDFWMAINPEAEKIPEDAIDELRAMGLDEEAAEYLMKEPKQRVLDPKRDQIVSRINTKLRENDFVLATRINGEKRYVFFNPKDPRSKRAATALKNLDA